MNEAQQKTVLALVVTHNRLELLKRCITHLQQQTAKPDLLIIDNLSTDGTKEYLTRNNIAHITQENTGSAGGWERGINEGWSRGYAFIWMMDDDGFPDADALKILLENKSAETICISSLVVKENARQELVFGMPRMNKRGLPVLLASPRKYNSIDALPVKDGVYPHAHLFNGALIDLEKIKMLGNVDRTYFMFGDEVDFYFRMRQAGQVCTAVKAMHYHPDVSQRTIDKKKVYYFIRNTIILNHLYFDKPLIRDFFTVGVALARIAKRNGIGQLFSYVAGTNSKFLYPAIADGFRKRKINRYT